MRLWQASLLLTTLTSIGACTSAELYPITGESGSAGAAGSSAAPQCNLAAPPSADSRQTVRVAGQSRSYVLHFPPSYDPARPAPLVLDFHGIGETGESELRDSPYPAALDREGVVMAFPDGLRGPAGTGWNVGPCCVANVDDVAFARAVVAHAQTLACVDATRVYAVGVLTGGGMAHYLGCHAADIFAGVAPAAFDLLEENVSECLPSRPVTVVSFRSTKDPRVPYAGGESSLVPGMPLTFLGATATFAKWGELNRCVGAPSAPDPNGCSAFTTCANGAEVVLCTREGEQQYGDPSVVWPALARHTL